MSKEFKPKNPHDLTPEERIEGKRYAKAIGVNFHDLMETLSPTTAENIQKNRESRKARGAPAVYVSREQMDSMRKEYQERFAHLSEEEFMKAIDAKLNEVD